MLMKRRLSLALALAALSGSLWHISAQESIPYHKDLRDVNALSDMTVIDADNDNKTWKGWASGARCDTNHRNYSADDWLITPAIHFEAGKAYEMTVEIGSYNSANEEQFEIYVGTAPTVEGMTIRVVEPTKTTTPYKYKDDPVPYVSAFVEVPESGDYYVGVHAISEPWKYYLICMSISIDEGVSPTAPADLEEVSILADPTGENRVDISFKAPSVNVMGNGLSGTVNVKMLRDDVEVKTWTVNPGETVTYSDNLEHRGLFTYRLIPSNANGDEGHSYLVKDLYVGPYGAAIPTGVTVVETETPGTVHVSWEPVTTDIHGTTLSAENITYQIYTKGTYGLETSFLESFPETEKDIVALSDPTKRKFVSYCVTAFNRGQAGDPSEMSELVALGAPYAMPMTLSGGSEVEFGSDNRNGVDWMVMGNVAGAESQDGDGLVIAGVGDAYNKTGDLHTAKIDLTDAESPLLEFYTYRFEADDRNTLTVFVKTDNRMEQLAVVDHASFPVKEWSKTRIPLDNYKGKIIQIIIRAKISGVSHTLIDNLSVKEASKFDMVAKGIVAPAQVAPGEDFDITVTVMNDGVKTASGASVSLYRNGDLISERTLADLPAGETAICFFGQKLTLFDEPEVEYTAGINFQGDELEDNNLFESVIVRRNINDFDGVSGLSGEKTSDGNVISWLPIDPDKPQGMKMTEDFESAESFADEYGDWTLLDRDGNGIGYMIEGAHGYQIPNHPSEQPAGFFIWDQQTSRFAGPCNAYSGIKFLASVYNYSADVTAPTPAVEDWAISPLLSGKAQTISLMAQTFDSGDGSHLEKMQIWYATEDTNNPEDFIMLDTFGDNGTYSVPCVRAAGNLSAYSRVEANLPAGALRFAIVSVTEDGWMLLVDDVTFTPDASINPLVFSGYNIYRDGEKLNETLLTEPQYIDHVTDNADHTYHVTAVYEPGESELSEPFTIRQSGILSTDSATLSIKAIGHDVVITGAEGLGYTIVAPDGKVIAAGEGNVRMTLPAGLYIVTSGTHAAKLYLR